MSNLPEQRPELGQLAAILAERTVESVKNLGDRMYRMRLGLEQISLVGPHVEIIIQPEIDFSPPGDGVGKLLTNLFLFEHINSHSLIKIVHSGSNVNPPEPHYATEEKIKVEILQEDKPDRSITVEFKAGSLKVSAAMSNEQSDATGKRRMDDINTTELVQETALRNLVLAEGMVWVVNILELEELKRLQDVYFPEANQESET